MSIDIDWFADMEDAREKRIRCEERERVLREIEAVMPKCGECGAVATHVSAGGTIYTCDAHAEPDAPRGYAPDELLPWTATIRRLRGGT